MAKGIDLSRMDCYAGKWRAEILESTPAPTDPPGTEPFLWIQFVEGCGYTTFELTPQEAICLGTFLIQSGSKLSQKST